MGYDFAKTGVPKKFMTFWGEEEQRNERAFRACTETSDMKFVTTRAKQRRGETPGQERHSGRTAKKEISKGGERMSTKSMMDVTEIVNELGVSKAFAYNLIKKFNNELKQKGFTTITGKVSRKYFEEQFYGMSDTNKEGA